MQALWEAVSRRQGTKIDNNTDDGEARIQDEQVGEGKSKFIEFAKGTHSE